MAFHGPVVDLVAAPGNSSADVFVRDVRAGVTELVSHDTLGAEGDGTSASDADNLDPGAPADPDNQTDVFLTRLR